MIYSDVDIRAALSEGKIIIDPISDDQIQPASIDLRLGNHWLVAEPNNRANLCTKIRYKSLNNNKFILYPGNMVLATTMERVSLPLDICARLEGRSSVGRLGIFVHNAGFIDPGWNGQITLELINMGNSSVLLDTGRRIAQLVLEELKTPCSTGYSGKYQNQNGATGSRIYLDKEAVLKAKYEAAMAKEDAKEEKEPRDIRLADENIDVGEMEDVSTGAGLEEREEIID